MADSQNQPAGTDGWVEGSSAGLRLDRAPEPKRDLRPVSAESAVRDGKALAILAHSSILFGVPLFIIPILKRDNEFALHHGKAAAVNFAVFIGAFFLTMASCGLLFPAVLLCYVPALVGVINAANGERAGSFGWGGVGERIFGGVQPKATALLEE